MCFVGYLMANYAYFGYCCFTALVVRRPHSLMWSVTRYLPTYCPLSVIFIIGVRTSELTAQNGFTSPSRLNGHACQPATKCVFKCSCSKCMYFTSATVTGAYKCGFITTKTIPKYNAVVGASSPWVRLGRSPGRHGHTVVDGYRPTDIRRRFNSILR